LVFSLVTVLVATTLYGVAHAMNEKLNEPFLNPSTTEKYRRLGFVSAGICMTLKISNVSISAVENPLSGVALFFESVSNRTACQYESCAPEKCGVEQIHRKTANISLFGPAL
jgi:hypothetical protein